jgi:partner of Y14 and mago protein
MPKAKRIAQANASPFPPGWHPDAAKAQTAKPKKQPSQQQQPPAVKKEPQVRVITKKENTESVKASAIDELADSMQNSLKIREDVIEISKRLKRLRRRLRELEVLEEKINSGEIGKPQKDQMEKIQRRGELAKEIEELEKTRDELKAQGGIKNINEES